MSLLEQGGSSNADLITELQLGKSQVNGFVTSDIDESNSDYNYYGFLDKDGAWYIQRINKLQTEFRYFKGTSSYTTNWGNRTILAYDYFNAIF